MSETPRRAPWALAILMAALGALYTVQGIELAGLGGSTYFVVAGPALLILALMLLQRNALVLWLFAVLYGLTFVWALFEVGLDLWALQVRLSWLTGFGLWLMLPGLRRKLGEERTTWQPVLVSVLFVVGFIWLSAAQYGDEALPLVERNGTVTPQQPTGGWLHYGNSNGGTRFARVDEITPANVSGMKEIWRYRTGIEGVFKATPIQIGDLLYTCAALNVIIALDAETGEKVWQFDPDVQASGFSFSKNCRGVTYHKAPDTYTGQCPERIITATTDARLLAVDAHTGQPCTDFGNKGTVSLLPGMGEVKPGFYFVTSPATIARGRAIVGGWVMDNREVGEPSGVVRAYDVLTGEFSWAWDMGRPGVNTQPEAGEFYTRGTPNVWSMTSFDEALGLVYLPTGNATPDYFGAHRSAAAEQFASSVVALDIDDGSLRWSYQTVHHDVWDYDVPSQPVLADLPQADGSVLPVVIAATKRAEIFVLDRRTGEPVFEVREEAVPQGAAEGDWLSPTQPMSVGMPDFRTPDLAESDTWGITPWDHLWCRIEFKKLRYEGHFTPPSVAGSLQYPGNAGGFNWGSVALHEDLQLLVVNPLLMPNKVHLIPREDVPEQHFQEQLGTPYAVSSRPFLSPVMAPCMRPPYGLLAVIDLQTQQLLWQQPVGDIEVGVNIPMGLPQLSGTVVTSGGIIFHAATIDQTVRAVDLRTGEELWRQDLPATSEATPMSYRAPKSGKQRLIVQVPAGGMLAFGEPEPGGGYVIAYGLE